MPLDQSQPLDLEQATLHCRLLADPTRLRLLLLLEQEELSVAELAAITQLAQPRVSTHLAKLRDAHLVVDRREGVFVYYRIATSIQDTSLAALWSVLRKSRADPLVRQDMAKLQEILMRRGNETWADSVAGDMVRHYSPGRTWEATARALVHLVEPGDVLDIASGDGVMAELLAPHARRFVGVDLSEKVIAAGRKRLAQFANVSMEVGDMHHLAAPDASFDTVLLMHALTYTREPQQVLSEAGRVLRVGGRLLAVTLAEHQHARAVEPYDHANLGFTPANLAKMAGTAGFDVHSCQLSTTETRTPNFGVISLFATRTSVT